MVIDYSHWDKMAKDIEVGEKREKVEERIINRLNFEKKQQQRIKDWEKKMRDEGKTDEEIEELRRKLQSQTCSHGHAGNSQGHGNSHGHSHGDEKCTHDHEEKEDIPEAPIRLGCGYADPALIEKARKQQEALPPLAERNKKKRKASEAAHEDGNIEFKKGNYELAIQIYERAILILNDMFDNDDFMECEALEAKLDLNLAACHLKLQNHAEAIKQCKMSKNIDSKNPKIYYRMAEGYMGLQKYEEASEQLKTLAKFLGRSHPSYKTIHSKLQKLKKLEDQQTEKSRKAMAKKLKKVMEETTV